jgi:hypothetical protein
MGQTQPNQPSPTFGEPGNLSAIELNRLRPVVTPDLAQLFARMDNRYTPNPADADAAADEFKNCRISRVMLGKLGSAIVVEAQAFSGMANAAMIDVYVASGKSYKRILQGSGFGPEVLPSLRPVPDVVFGWAGGGCQVTYERYRYKRGHYRVNACDLGDDQCGVHACNEQLPTVAHPWPIDASR